MKTVLDKSTRAELISRINSLNERNVSNWGKMNVYQMVKHCTIWDQWIQGIYKPKFKREFLGLIIGRMVLKSVLKDDSPLRRNTPTTAAFKVKETHGDIESEKKKWIALIEGYEFYSTPEFMHDFFGKMTREQVGMFAYKHSDHHLRQFNG